MSDAMLEMSRAAERAAQGLVILSDVIAQHREQWLCEGEGQWPDKFSLLNRYVRTNLEPPFILND